MRDNTAYASDAADFRTDGTEKPRNFPHRVPGAFPIGPDMESGSEASRGGVVNDYNFHWHSRVKSQ